MKYSVLSIDATDQNQNQKSKSKNPMHRSTNSNGPKRIPAPTTAASFPKSKAVILLGGPHQQDNHFRPLSLDLPKPLFPVAGREMLYHHVEACSRVENMEEIIMIGSYDEGLFARFFDKVYRELDVPVRYLKEEQALGTAGGMRFFKSSIMKDDPKVIYVLHCDICCTFPVQEMMRFHLRHGGECTLLGKRVFHGEVQKYGCLVQHPETREVLHWAEKPETFVSDIINCGIYILDASMLNHLAAKGDALAEKRGTASLSASALKEDVRHLFPDFKNLDALRLEQDVLMPLAGTKKLYVFETGDFWCPIKSPGMALTCSEMYMQRFRYTDPHLLSQNNGEHSPIIEGNVIIDKTADVHPTAKIGPNVCIAAGVTVGAGARISHSIILEGVTIKEHACVLFSILGWNSIVGQWARIEGQPPGSRVSSHQPPNSRPHGASGPQDTSLVHDLTVFGVSVVANPEIVVRNCIVLPHKQLSHSYQNEILL